MNLQFNKAFASSKTSRTIFKLTAYVILINRVKVANLIATTRLVKNIYIITCYNCEKLDYLKLDYLDLNKR